MTIQHTSLMGMITGKMSYLAQRQKLLAQNIANADTPEYRAKDLKAFSVRDLSAGSRKAVPVATTSHAHLAPATSRDVFDKASRPNSYEVSPDGNRVVIEEQLMKLNAVNGEHKLATSLHKKYVNMYHTALKAQ